MYASDLDENLILRMAEGDGSAFREFYEKTSAAVYGFALSILRNGHDAEDITHDAYIRVYTAAVTYIPGRVKPMTWMLTIVRNLCYTKLRSGRVHAEPAEYDLLADNAAYAEDSESMMDRLVLKKALEILESEERQIVMLHSLTGLKHREIAEIMEMPVGTVLSKYNRALKKMRKEIEGKQGVKGKEAAR